MNSDDIFRKEAIEHHNRGGAEGQVLLILPEWTRWTYTLLLAVLGAGITFTVVGSVPQYAEGPAVIRAEQQIAVTASLPGVVSSIPVVGGTHVSAGEVLVRFESLEEDAQIAALNTEFNSALVRMLTDPLDAAARQALAGLRAQRELLMARLAQRVVRAPQAGIVSDVRVKPGQHVLPGAAIASIGTEQGGVGVVVLVPGQQRPGLDYGQPLRLELSGFPYEYQTATIERIDDQVIGPQEVKRMLGPEIADSVPVTGPVVVVYGRLPGATFVADGQTYRYFDGMTARAWVQVRSERILRALMPGTKLVTRKAP